MRSVLFFPILSISLPLSFPHSSKKVESEGGASAAKKDSKRKREPSVSDDVEVAISKSPPPSPPEDDDDDGVQVQAAPRKALVLPHVSTFQTSDKNSRVFSQGSYCDAEWFQQAQQKAGYITLQIPQCRSL